MSKSLSRIPSGMRYYFGQEAHLRRTIEDIATGVFHGWSYEEIATPTVDYYSLFEHGMGSSEAPRAFRFTDNDGRMLALRPDVTSGVARAAATLFAERQRPLRLCYVAPIFRQKAPSHAEWRRESTQVGGELLGANTSVADMEILAVASEVLSSLGVDYLITLNDIEIFNGVAEHLTLDPVSRDEMRQCIDSRNAADLERFLGSHTSADDGPAFAQLMRLSGKRETLDKARRVITNTRSNAALDRLECLWGIIESLGLANHFEIDLGDVSRLDYYTGLTFKIYVDGVGTRVGSGGRYDGLTASFGKAEPAVGFVLDLDVLTDVLLSRVKIAKDWRVPEERVPPLKSDDPATLFHKALEMRSKGDRVVLDFGEVTLCRS